MVQTLINWTRELLLGKEPLKRKEVRVEDFGWPLGWVILDAPTGEIIAIELDSREDCEQYCELVKLKII